MRRLVTSRPLAAAATGIAVLLIAGGGYALAGSGGSISVCVHRHGGALYQARRCARRDGRLTWSVQGPRGPRGIQGVAGAAGAPGPITGTLPHGVTLKGAYDINQPVAAAGQAASTSISFGLQLASAPTVHYIKAGAAVPTGCSGTASNPGAASGNLCIFEAASANGSAGEVDPLNPVSGSPNTATVFGAAVSVVSGAPGAFATYGTWAVTG